MQLHSLRLARCRVCERRAVWVSGMCRPCSLVFVKHRDLWALDRYLDSFYPKAPQ
jgi:hypothetical protein